MREQRLGEVDTEPAEEEEADEAVSTRRSSPCLARDLQERDPSEVLDEGVDEVTLAEAVLEQCKANVPGARENHGARQPDFETVLVESVDGNVPTKQEIVQNRQDRRTCQPIYTERQGLNDIIITRYSQYENIYAIMLIL